jgi:hypothetical protein
MLLNAQLTRQIQNLDVQSLEALRLFIERLLNRRLKNAKKTPDGKQLLADMERIPIPVNNIIVDRADLYDDRI